MNIIYKKMWDGTIHYLQYTHPITWNGLIDNAFKLPSHHALDLCNLLQSRYKADILEVM